MLGMALVLSHAGCATDKEARLQADDEAEHAKYNAKTVGDVTEYATVEPIPMYGVGLVTGLNGTGGSPPQSEYTRMLREQLKKQDIKDVNKLLESRTTSVVLISGRIPAGAHKNDTIDLEISLPPGSKTTSLRGGYLQPCVLHQYEYAGALDPNYHNPAQMFQGHAYVRAEGKLQVGLGDGDEDAKTRQGRIWGGGRVREDISLQLLLKPENSFAVVANNVATRINESFRSPFVGASGNQVATAKSDKLVVLNVPQQYQHNLPRFMRVVRLVPLRENPAVAKKPQSAGDSDGAVPYRRQLQEDLLDPHRTVTAALRLEALGTDSIATLKTGLTSDHALVRFSSAEALAYLDSPSCGQELARLIETQPLLRAYCLTAMASMDQAVCHVKLAELLASPNPEVRYGAFRALRALDEKDPALHGELLSKSFWLHHVAPDSPAMVHLSTSRRAEIVLFGEDAYLQTPFAIRTGEFAITAAAGDTRCTIAHCSTEDGTSHRQCSLKLDDVLHTLADEGGMYPEAVELLRQAHLGGSLSCRVEVDALPQAVTVQALAQIGLNKKADEESDQPTLEILNAKGDFGATPTLYEKDPAQRTRAAVDQDKEAAVRDHKQQEARK
jgi:flagellar basal body P-ring protein FlgI